ncbi:MAG: hypothetical protein MJ066_02175, partial [Clostridia bacterium]|nr:hypothetical protein [Clostridia bacterium]
FWQGREVFNHIAPLMESRLARFHRISPVISVRPKSDDDSDVSGAGVAEKLLYDFFSKNDVKETMRKVNEWSETCGTGFYKVVWNNFGGNEIGKVDGKSVYEGEVEISAVSPFEIFPDNLFSENIAELKSIIHARAMSVKEIEAKYNVKISGRPVGVYSLSYKNGESESANSLSDAEIVIEKYERPSKDFPNGRVITVAGNKLLYYGELPYLNGDNKTRVFPFIKQESISIAGSFFGSSIIERLIPVQRAYNAVKNRKHEFLNRLSMGIMKVEDGSVDVDDLESEGLPPGKVLVYRQGSSAPEMMALSMPNDFDGEEERLLNEFVSISGVSDVSSSSTNAKLSSGSALELLVEQDNERLVVPAERIRDSFLEIAKSVIRLYAQFLAGVRAVKFKDSFGKTKVAYFDSNATNSDEVYIENENELLYSNAKKKDMIFKLYNSGLLFDSEGKLRPVTKEKVLSLLGYKDLDYQKGVSEMQELKAQSENEKIKTSKLDIEEIDDDDIHIEEHTRYALSEYDELTKEQKNNIFEHIRKHKERLQIKGEN